MLCIITSPKKTMQYNNIQSVLLPAFSGEMQVLPRHAEAFVILKKGNVVLKQEGEKKKIINIDNAQCYVRKGQIVIIL